MIGCRECRVVGRYDERTAVRTHVYRFHRDIFETMAVRVRAQQEERPSSISQPRRADEQSAPGNYYRSGRLTDVPAVAAVEIPSRL